LASNFKIISQKNKGSLHIRLTGDFDGSSACELINALEACNETNGKIVIDTCGLLSIHPFGRGVFHKYCSGRKLPPDVTFTGKYGRAIKPKRGLSL
jgi:hypothetical protein